MVGATLSRWTMTYFAVALLSFAAAQSLMVAGYGFPNAPINAAPTLIVVHIVAIGWLSLLVCGSLFQFVPVLIARPLYSNSLPLPTLGFLAAGLIGLLLGFLQFANGFAPNVSLLPLGATLLDIGFALVLWNLGRTLWAARPLALPARFVTAGLFSLAAAAALGIIFALVLGGATVEPHLAALTAFGLPLHVIAGVAGWLTLTAMGVSYRLLAMFMLAPESEGTSTRVTLYLGVAALTVGIVGGVVAIASHARLAAILGATGVLGLGALTFYGRDVIQLYRLRKRRAIELNSRVSAMAVANLGASAILAIVLIATGTLNLHIGALVFLAVFGWLSGLGLAQLYKIVAFLTWLECYGPMLGKILTPRVQDLVVERRAWKWFALYFIAVWSGTAAMLAGQAAIFRGASAAMLVATIGITAQLLRARRLADVSPVSRLPQGVHAPRLLVSYSPQTERGECNDGIQKP
jgi:hypothetical protein